MPPTLSPEPLTLNPQPSTLNRGVKLWLPILLFAILWADLIRQLSYTWETNEQYAYGWFVPLLALALLWRRWLTRPAAPTPNSQLPTSACQHFSFSAFALPASPISPFQRFSLSAFIVLVCLSLLPLRVIHEINQDWPLISWPLTLIVVALTLYAFHLADPWRGQLPVAPDSISAFSVSAFSFSRLSPWVKHFAFPVCFILVAVQWPYRIEHTLTQSLMQVVASLTVEVLGWFNLPAFQRGNLIEISTGVVGVNEACSGIRSFQSTLMGALFLGELYRLHWTRRFSLIAGGLFLAFGLNVVRTLILTWHASTSGLAALEKWHDPAGLTIFLVCFASLWAIAGLMKRGGKSESRKQKAEKAGEPSLPVSDFISEPSGAFQPSTRSHQHLPSPATAFQLSAFPISAFALPAFSFQLCRRYLVAVGLWSLLCLVATEVWYRSHEVRRADTAKWWVSYPTNFPSFQPVTVSKASAKLLKHDVERGGSWDEPDGTKWSVYCFRWKEGDPTARMSAQGHRPEYCMVGSGHDLVAVSGTQYLKANGIELPFRLYTFDSAERLMHVFFCLWEDGAETQTGFGETKQGDRLRTAWAGRRGLGQQTLEIICNGYPDMATAEQAVRTRMPELIRIEPPDSLRQSAANSR